MTKDQQQTADERPEDSDYDRASLNMAQDDFYNDGHTIKLEKDDPMDSHYIQLDQSEIPRQPIATQIKPFGEPQVHWGVHFVHEDVITDYGVGEAAKAAANRTVQEWAETDYPAEVVSSVVYPWRGGYKQRLELVREMRDGRSPVMAVKSLRTWLYQQDLDEEIPRKTGLSAQVPLMREVREAKADELAADILMAWLLKHGYHN